MQKAAHYRLLAGVVGLLVAVGAVQAADLHFIVLADTTDVSIGTVDDLNNAQTWAQAIATNTGLTLNFQSLSGAQLTEANVRTLLGNVQAGVEDVIYFYYTGHGGNPGNVTWPVFYFVNSTQAGSEVSFDEVVETLQPKNPRLLVVLADCCNNYPSQAGYPFHQPTIRDSSQYAQAFQQLFVDFQGTVLASGCEPGQFSLGGQGQGGLFTNTFMDSFYSLAGTQSVLIWDDVLSKTKTDAKAEALQYGENQVPQYLIKGGLVASQTPEDLSLNTTDGISGSGTSSESSTGGGLTLLPAGGLCGMTGAMPLALTLSMLALPMLVRRHRSS